MTKKQQEKDEPLRLILFTEDQLLALLDILNFRLEKGDLYKGKRRVKCRSCKEPITKKNLGHIAHWGVYCDKACCASLMVVEYDEKQRGKK